VPLFDKFMAAERRRRTVADSIVDNLRNILNVKREYGSLWPDLGIRSLTEYRSREGIAAAVMDDVRQNIEHYEPRLRLDEIVLEQGDSPFRLSFSVRCSLVGGSQMLQVSFDTVFGKCDVMRR
jgi:type VI secretion system lysozyme-like protein